MENEDQSAGGTDAEVSGGTETNNESNDQNNEPNDKPEVVSRQAYDSVSKDMHRFKREAAEAKQELADAKAKKLADEKNFEELHKLEQERRIKAEEREQKKDQYYVHTQVL